jgi:hypothetical protein
MNTNIVDTQNKDIENRTPQEEYELRRMEEDAAEQKRQALIRSFLHGEISYEVYAKRLKAIPSTASVRDLAIRIATNS